MTAESGHGLLMMLKEHAEEWQRQIGAYEQLKSNSSDVFEDAVNIAARTMKRAVAPPLAGPAADFMGGMLSYHEYMPMSLEPTNIDFERLVAKAKSDFSAYLVLRLAALMAVDDGNLPALKRAKQELALEIFPAPRRPRGRSPYANVSRDTLIVSEIEKLLTVGFAPARNRGTASRDSACDVIVAALVLNGYHMLTYEGVEKIWTSRSDLKRPEVLALAFCQVLGIELPQTPSTTL
jgi:hypothetical protein